MSMRTVLPKVFFQRPTLLVAEELLGKFLVLRTAGGEELSFEIREVEAYDGPEDRASHAFRGETPRTSVMFAEGGCWYIYLIYGMYWMLNIVTGPERYPAAVLVRTVGEWNGPGKLTKALGIDKRFHSASATKETGLWIEDRGRRSKSHLVLRTPRIGIAYAGPFWSQQPYRFVLKEDENGRVN